MELFFAVFVMHGGDQHTAGINAHHRAGRQVRNGDAGLADELFRFIILVNSAQNDPICAGSVVERELQKLLGLLDGLAVEHLYGTEIGLGEGLKVDKIGEQRLYLDLGEIYLLLRCGCGGGSFDDLFGLLFHVERLHCGDDLGHRFNSCYNPT